MNTDREGSVRRMCRTALMAAVVCVMTMVVRIPIPLGYAHLGDAFIFLTVLFLGKRAGCWAGALGSCMADLLGGFAYWSIPTFFIKFLMAAIAGQILYGAGTCRLRSKRTFVALVLATVWMVVGYTAAGAMLYRSVAAGLTSAPGLALKGVLNIAVAYGVGAALEKAHLRALLAPKKAREHRG